MVIELAAIGRAIVLVEATDPAAIEIAQFAGIADRLGYPVIVKAAGGDEFVEVSEQA